MTDLLKIEFINVQKNYLNLLKKIDTSGTKPIDEFVLEQINLFWYANKEIVNLYLEYMLSKKDSFVYSAASFFNIEDKNNDGFLLMGNYHIFDDPLPDYIEILNSASDKKFKEEMRLLIENLVKNNIQLIEKTEKDILVLPLRYLFKFFSENEEELNHKAALSFIFSLFTDISTLEEYQAQIKNASELEGSLKEEVKQVILLSEEDDTGSTFERRLRDCIDRDNVSLEFEETDAEVFFRILYGRIRQAQAVFDISLFWNLIPFSVGKMSQYYFNLVANSMFNQANQEVIKSRIKNFIDKSNAAYILNKELSKKDYDVPLEILRSRAKDLEVEKLLYDFDNVDFPISDRIKQIIDSLLI